MSNLTNQELASKLSVLLSDVVTYRFLAQGYHWNVKGPEFIQFHDFFGAIYEDAEGAIDALAENIRKVGFDAPGSLTDFVSLTCIDSPAVPSGHPVDMSRSLYSANAHLIECHYSAFAVAEEMGKQGIMDYLAGRIDMLEKFQWQLGTTIGADATQISQVVSPTPRDEEFDYAQELLSDY